CARDHSGFDVW
nr:immunoglobulin heavy chain junction region [Macaca mulatta]MOV53052.1 immunoglobulin heavy chain junction region [Macaca mulatta]